MESQYFRPEDSSRHLYANNNNTNSDDNFDQKKERRENLKDEDLIIEDNTVYEIDRACYERLRNQKRRK